MLPNFQGRLPPVPLSQAAKRACQAAMLGAASAKPMRRLLRARNLLKVRCQIAQPKANLPCSRMHVEGLR